MNPDEGKEDGLVRVGGNKDPQALRDSVVWQAYERYSDGTHALLTRALRTRVVDSPGMRVRSNLSKNILLQPCQLLFDQSFRQLEEIEQCVERGEHRKD